MLLDDTRLSAVGGGGLIGMLGDLLLEDSLLDAVGGDGLMGILGDLLLDDAALEAVGRGDLVGMLGDLLSLLDAVGGEGLVGMLGDLLLDDSLLEREGGEGLAALEVGVTETVLFPAVLVLVYFGRCDLLSAVTVVAATPLSGCLPGACTGLSWSLLEVES